MWRDTRPNRFYPLKGSVIDFTGDFFAQDLGSKYSFQSYKFTFNKYASLTNKQVLAYNFHFCGTGGSPPFYGNCIYGANNELRGYTAGRYLDRFMWANPARVSTGLAMAFRLGWIRRCRCSRSRRRSVENRPTAAQWGTWHPLHAEQKVPCQSEDRFCMGQRQFHLGRRGWRSVLGRPQPNQITEPLWRWPCPRPLHQPRSSLRPSRCT